MKFVDGDEVVVAGVNAEFEVLSAGLADVELVCQQLTIAALQTRLPQQLKPAC